MRPGSHAVSLVPEGKPDDLHQFRIRPTIRTNKNACHPERAAAAAHVGSALKISCAPEPTHPQSCHPDRAQRRGTCGCFSSSWSLVGCWFPAWVFQDPTAFFGTFNSRPAKLPSVPRESSCHCLLPGVSLFFLAVAFDPSTRGN